MADDSKTPIPGETPTTPLGTSPGSTPIPGETTRPVPRGESIPGETMRVVQGGRGVPGERTRALIEGAHPGERTVDLRHGDDSR